MWQQINPSLHGIIGDHLGIFILTRAKKDVLAGRECSWHIYINFSQLHYGYVQIDNAFIGTIDQAKQYAESKLKEIKESIPL
jgi:hypothetical protein